MRRVSVLVLSFTLSGAGLAHSTALKVCNDTDYSWRVDVDLGPWQQFNPQPQWLRSQLLAKEHTGWDCIKRDVGDRYYRVRFEYLGHDSQWHPAFDIQMWGGYFTNIVQIVDDGTHRCLRMWWEPRRDYNDGVPCRDKPPLRGVRSPGCLWARDETYCQMR